MMSTDPRIATRRSPTGRPKVSDALVEGGELCDQGFADLSISECLPEVTVYRVTTSATLDPFLVQVIRGGEPVGAFTRPPRNSDLAPTLDTVKDAREPSAILAALGILAARFGA